MIASPYRDVTGPILDYVRNLRKDSPRDVVTVYIPEYVVGHWWEQILHNQSALRLKGRLLFTPGVMVTSVPYLLQSSGKAEERLGGTATTARPRRSCGSYLTPGRWLMDHPRSSWTWSRSVRSRTAGTAWPGWTGGWCSSGTRCRVSG